MKLLLLIQVDKHIHQMNGFVLLVDIIHKIGQEHLFQEQQ